MFFISKALALKIHQQQIGRFGGSPLLRDEALLESALGAAEQTWHYTQDIYQAAAHIVTPLPVTIRLWTATNGLLLPVCWYF
jgi:prophage maintenance system killer protein